MRRVGFVNVRSTRSQPEVSPPLSGRMRFYLSLGYPKPKEHVHSRNYNHWRLIEPYIGDFFPFVTHLCPEFLA